MSSRTTTTTPRVLFICEANRSRSPLAEAMLRRRLTLRGIRDIAVESAGLAAEEGTTLVGTAHELATEHGLTLSLDRAARPVRPVDVQRAALVLTMTEEQRRTVCRMVPAAATRVFTLLELDRLLASAPGLPARVTDLARIAHRRRPLVAPAGEPEDVADPTNRPHRAWDQLYATLDPVLVRLAAAVAPGMPTAGRRDAVAAQVPGPRGAHSRAQST